MTTPIVICFLTYQRTAYALKTIGAFRKLCAYPDLRWYVADDGSRREHYLAVLSALEGAKIIGSHSDRISYGAGANRALFAAKDHSQFTFWLEDDWELTAPLDLMPYVNLLENARDIGMVRLGYLNENMRGQVFGYQGSLYWRLDRSAAQYTFTGHPSLRHARFHQQYGTYYEGLVPGDTEIEMDATFRMKTGCDIVFPAINGEMGNPAHIGAEKSYHV